MSRDEARAQVTFGPVPAPLQTAFRSALGLRGEVSGGEWKEDGQGIFYVSLNSTVAGAATFDECGLLDLLRTLGVAYDCMDDASGEWDGAEERWRPGMELPFRCRRDGGDLVMGQFQWSLMKREAGTDTAALMAAVDALLGTEIPPIPFGWVGL